MSKISSNNLIIDYDMAGYGAPIVFIHGITESKKAFYYQMTGLQNDYKVINYNLRLGLKNSAEYTLDLLVDDLKRFLEMLNISSAVICGHSFGSLIAIQFALTCPHMTNALVIISGLALHPNIPDNLFDSLSASGKHNGSMSIRLRLQVSKLFKNKFWNEHKKSHENPTLRTLALEANLVSKTTVSQRMRIIKKTDVRDLLPAISAPTLVTAGANDRAFMLSGAQYMYEHIPDSSLEVIENSGHFCFITHHDLFNAALDEFLKERLTQIF